MNFQRLGSQHDRRRTLLKKEAEGSLAHASSADSLNGGLEPSVPAPRYHHAAQLHQQARVTDLLPIRKRALLGLFALGGSFISVLLGLHGLSHGSHAIAGLKLSLLNLEGPGSLAGWFASILMLKSAALAVVIYVLRRHRLDDYRARYRLWLWTAAACIMMSIDEVTGLHEDIQAFLTIQIGASGPWPSVSWWLGTWSLVVALLSVRLWLEIRDSRWSSTMLTVGVGFWGIHFASRMNWLPAIGLSFVIVSSGAKLLGHLCLWFTLSVYGRHVMLDIEGKVPVRVRKTWRKRSSKPAAANTLPDEDSPPPATQRPHVMVDAPHVRDIERTSSGDASPLSKRTDLGPHHTVRSGSSDAHADAADEEEDDLDPSEYRKLSRAERRKLRRKK